MRRPARLAAILAAAISISCRNADHSEARSAPAVAREPRDLVLVTIDTLRYDALGFDGNPRGTSPNLDRLAAGGRVYTFAHAHNVLTLPSHVNILTGLYPYQHGVRDNAGFRLSPKIETVAAMLQARGYATGAFVGAFPLDSRYGLAPGFDVYEEMYKQVDQPQDFEIQQARASEVVARALEWYHAAAGKPRFLWVHLYDPHAPYDPPEPWRQRFAADPYLGEVAYTDSALAPLLEAVRAGKPAPFLAVTADHGEARGDHGEQTHGLFAYEATLHVPLLLWCPDLLAAGRDTAAARHVDLAPTLLDAAGDRTARRLPGRSLLSSGAAQDSYFESLSSTFTRGWAPLRGFLGGREKYIDLPIPELYDLSADPAERHNLAGTPSEGLRRLKTRLEALPDGSTSRETVTSEEAEKLRSLGYLSGSAQARRTYGPADDPKNLIAVDQQLHRVVELYEEERFAEAIGIARNLVAQNPKMMMGYLQLAFLKQYTGDLPGALAVYEQAAKQGVSDEGLDRKRALLLAETGRAGEAVRILEKYRESDDLETLNALGIALTDAGRPAEGLAAFDRARAIQPRNAQSFQNAGLALLQLGRLEEARQSLETALSISRRSPRSLNALGVVYSRLGEPGKAIEAWKRCVEVDPEQFEALYNLGRLAGNQGDLALARQALTRFANTAPPSRYRKDIAEVRAVLVDLDRSDAVAGRKKP